MGSLKVAGLFAGIGGVELGLHRSGHETLLLSEIMPPAQTVLRARFPEIDLVPDVRDVTDLPADTDLVAAGFPCQNLSQAGMVAGITGSQSGLVNEVFRILQNQHPTWLLVENVPFMLQLGRGAAMHHITTELEALGMRWAYRVVDSRSVGVPQRRRRVILLASATEDPRPVLYADDAGDREDYRGDAFGFYWTEGLRGLGWAKDAIPTLKGGSSIGIPSPPAIWLPEAEPGERFVTPGLGDGEALQGFERGWTGAVEGTRSRGARWKLVGNAVTVGVAEWVGHRLSQPGDPLGEYEEFEPTRAWPTAAWGDQGGRWKVNGLSEFPVREPYQHLLDTVRLADATPLSHRAAAGFLSRTERAKLRFDPDFIVDMKEHVELTRPGSLLSAAVG